MYRALSIIDRPVEVVKLPMFISATTFEMDTYGECCTHYKERLGLESKSKQDLFVLRNVVSYSILPFPSPPQTYRVVIRTIIGYVPIPECRQFRKPDC